MPPSEDPIPDLSPDPSADPFTGIVGQASAIDYLRRALAAGRLPHGMLFAGPKGVGKGTTAAALARVFLGTPDRPLPARGLANHPDYHVVTRDLIRLYDRDGTSKAVQFSIEVVREGIVAAAARSSVSGVGKVFVVRDPETMTLAAQNALLKTLEEPAGRALLVLTAERPGELLATVRSRCQVVRFAPLNDRDVRRGLTARGVDDPSAEAATRLAGGSLGVAWRYAQDGVPATAAGLFETLDRLLDGRPLSTDGLTSGFKAAAEAYADQAAAREPLGSRSAFVRDGGTLYLNLMGEHLRRRLREAVDAGRPDDASRLGEAIDATAEAEALLESNVGTALALASLSAALRPAGRS